MTDRELLELAAKAAGLEITTRFGDGFRARIGKHDNFEHWNPLTDDGDALRLAVSLGISIEPFSSCDGSAASYTATATGGIFEEPHNGDPYAATRRAITRAAAAIGEAMP
jgi:hypothetical protein